VTLAVPAVPALIPANTIASYSDLGKHAQCKRAWWLSTYRRLRPLDEPPTGPLPFGSRIHAALEAYYDGTLPSPVLAWTALMAHEYAVDESNGGMHTASLDKESKLGHTMLEGYLEWVDESGEDAKYEVIGVEDQLQQYLTMEARVDGEDYVVSVLVRGKLDRRLRRKSDGAVLVGDFKTTASVAETAIADQLASPQPRLYLMLERAHAPQDQWSAGFVITMLRKVLRTKTSNPPYYMRLEHTVTPVELEAYTARLRGAVEDLATTQLRLDAGRDPREVAYFNPGWWCKTCPFKLACDLMQTQPAGAEAMLSDLFYEGDVWARYLAAAPGETGDASPNF
jgi:hypothetical protein